MKKIMLFMLFLSGTLIISAQGSRIKNTRASIDPTGDLMIVNYDLKGKKSAFDVKLEVTGADQQMIIPKSISGDIGNLINPGKNKKITWDLYADQVNLTDKSVNVKVTGNIFSPGRTNNGIWIPWLYIASGACAATGVVAHIRANQLYNDYPPSASTLDAEKLHKDVDRMMMIRNVAFGAAGGLGIAGVIVHIKHNQQRSAVALSGLPIQNGAVIGLTFKF